MTRWYVIQVRPSAEKKVAEALGEYAVTTFVPMERFLLRNRYATHKRERAVVRGYVFAQLPEDMHPLVHDIDGAIGVHSNNGRPVSANPWQLLRLWCAEQMGAFDSTRPKARREFRKGERVKITAGYAAGEIGEIAKLKGNRRARVTLDAVCSYVDAEFDQMEPEDEGAADGVNGNDEPRPTRRAA